jgi:predicted nucleic acid-binding protein
MRLVVTDANVFIDMEVAGVLEDMFRLEAVDFAVPNVLYIEELAAHHSRLPGLGLQIISLEPDAIEYAETLKPKYRKASQNDLFALALAKAQACALLTGDRRLREAADAEAVEVHGTVWLMEQLLGQKLLDGARAKECYERMQKDGSRLPWPDIEEQLARWR